MSNTTTHPYTVVAFRFDSAPRAAEFTASAVRLESEGRILINDLVLLEARADGRVRAIETTDVTTGAASVSGAAWGGLLGLVLGVPILGLALGAGLGAWRGQHTDYGISDGFVDSVRAQLRPGKFAVMTLVSHIDSAAVMAELERFPGTELLASTLDDDAIDAIRKAVEAEA